MSRVRSAVVFVASLSILPAFAERPRVFSMSCKVPSCNGELNTPEGRERAIEWFRWNRITKLWLESCRHAERVETKLLEEEREGWKWCGRKCSVSCHCYKKSGRRDVAYQNVTGESQKVDGHDLAPHGFLLVEDAK